MRVAVLSDIHANRQALAAVAKDIEGQRIDETWCLGDVVGYGADPRECLDWVEEYASAYVKGNHDHAVASGDMAWFNPVAAQAARYHAQVLAPPDRARLFVWPEQELRRGDGLRVLLVHGSPDDPLHEYVRPSDAPLGLRRWEGRADLILMGHTHVPFLAAPKDARAPHPWSGVGFHDDVRANSVGPAAPILVNPGSVGQPRDGDPRASYLVLDLGERRGELRRVSYDVETAAHAILSAGLDQSLAARLLRGR
jgi:predicted phosphodiesterase